MVKQFHLAIFTRGFTAVLIFNSREAALGNYDAVMNRCGAADTNNPSVLTISDENGNKVSFQDTFLVGLKLDCVDNFCEENNELRDLQIQYHKLLIQHAQDELSGERWKKGFEDDGGILG